VLRGQILSRYTLPATRQLSINLPAKGGMVRVNSLPVKEPAWQGTYFQGIPVQLSAIADKGYKFSGWSDPALPQSANLSLSLTQDTTLQPLFTPLGAEEGLRIIAPQKLKAGEDLTLILSARDQKGRMLTSLNDTVYVNSRGILADSAVFLKRGLGTLHTSLSQNQSLRLSAAYGNLSSLTKNIQVMPGYTQESYSGTLPAGEITWNAEKDRLITADLTIPADSRLIIEAGTRILLGNEINVFVYGALDVRGTEEQPVQFISADGPKPWGGIEFYGSVSQISYSFFVNAGGDPEKGWKHMNIQPILFARQESELNLNHVFILNSPGKALGSEYSRLTFKNGVIAFVQHGGEFVYTQLNYDGCYIMNLPDDRVVNDSGYVDYDNDGMHVDYVYSASDQPSRIKNSVFYHGLDDAIDHHYAKLEVVNCWLDDWVHEGVAASGGNYVKVFNTLAINSGQGFECGNGSPQLYLDHCTAFNNLTGIRFGDSYHTPATGHITATNCISYGNKNNIRNYVKNLSAPYSGGIDISYSMTNDNYDADPDYNTYPFCITGEPQFNDDFYLLPQSDGAAMGIAGSNMGRADSIVLSGASVIINEIMYNTAGSMDSEDWIELFNGQSVAQNIGGWLLKDDKDDHEFELPQNTSIRPFGYVVLCKDTTAFRKIYPQVKNILGNFNYGFGKGDQVRLFTNYGVPVDGLTYGISAPWPASANGDGPSLELAEYDSDNADARNWRASDVMGGTPGEKNSRATGLENSSQGPALSFELEQNYPNPFNPETKIRWQLSVGGFVKLDIYNILGQKVRTLVNGRREAGKYSVRFNAASLPSGLYFYRLRAGNRVAVRKMMLVH